MIWQTQKKPVVRQLARSLRDASIMLGVSIGHLRNEYRRGRLQLIKSGRRTLVTEEELERYLAECCKSVEKPEEVKTE